MLILLGIDKDEKFFLYKFLNQNNEIVYIGKTNNLKRRIAMHSNDNIKSIIPNFNETVHKIQYSKFNSEYKVSIYEIHYIVKYRPIYNTEYNNDCNEELFEFPTLEWFDYFNKGKMKRYLLELGLSKEYADLFLKSEQKVSSFLKKEFESNADKLDFVIQTLNNEKE